MVLDDSDNGNDADEIGLKRECAEVSLIYFYMTRDVFLVGKWQTLRKIYHHSYTRRTVYASADILTYTYVHLIHISSWKFCDVEKTMMNKYDDVNFQDISVHNT